MTVKAVTTMPIMVVVASHPALAVAPVSYPRTEDLAKRSLQTNTALKPMDMPMVVAMASTIMYQ